MRRNSIAQKDIDAALTLASKFRQCYESSPGGEEDGLSREKITEKGFSMGFRHEAFFMEMFWAKQELWVEVTYRGTNLVIRLANLDPRCESFGGKTIPKLCSLWVDIRRKREPYISPHWDYAVAIKSMRQLEDCMEIVRKETIIRTT